jgi:hypothetical protein
MREVKFWKPVGGNTLCVIIKGRWYWVGAPYVP